MRWQRFVLGVLIFLGFILGLAGLALIWWRNNTSDSNAAIATWLRSYPPELATLQMHACPEAPFMLPSEGFIGLLWADTARPYNPLRQHTGIDIFGAGAPGTVPIYAAYEGWLTRLDTWRSTVIIRHDDPLQPGRTIWTYYTHMADISGTTSFVSDAFPAGTHEVFVRQGTLLGYQGDYNGNSFGIAMHLHFSIVQSDATGTFMNEAVIGNTLDPSPYFGLPLALADEPARPIRCTQQTTS